MKKSLIISLILLALGMSSYGQDILNQFKQPSSLLKPTLTVRCVRDLRYWKQPTLDNFWSWMPKLQFMVAGPIEDASYFTYEFFTPDGKLWYSIDSKPFAIAANEFQTFESEAVPRWQDNRSSIATGLHSFKITLKNPLQGTNKIFYEGKFNVKKEFAGTANAAFKNQYIFYIDQDWALPMAFLNINAKIDEKAPVFQATMWFRGDYGDKLAGYLFHNGKQVAFTENGGVGQVNYILNEGDDKNKFRWEQQTFTFMKARYFDNDGSYNNRFVMKKNPGNYEVKILLDGELVRTVAFTVGADGKIVDNNIAKNNGISGFGVLVPATVIPVKEGTLNLMSYKTDAFYGNILNGFSVQ